MPKTSANDWTTRQRIEKARAEHVAANGPACQLCGTVPKTRGLQWDHDHKTGAHRGWLCHRCNRALPTWVTVEWLFKAAMYLGGEVTIETGIGPDNSVYQLRKITTPKGQE